MTFEHKDFRDYSNFLNSIEGREQRRLVIFHHSDMDGAFAGASVFRQAPKLQECHGFPTPEFRVFPVNYKEFDVEEILSNIDKNSDVFVVDFCFPLDISEAIHEKAGFFVTLDHHRSSALKIGDRPWAIFDMASSGALMAWNYFSVVKGAAPLAITLADNRDLWKKTDGREDQFHEVGMLTRNDVYALYPDKAQRNVAYMQELQIFLENDEWTAHQIRVWGTPVIAKRDANIAYVANAGNLIHTTIGGHPAVIFNYNVDQSDACEYIYRQEEYADKIVATFSIRPDGINFSMRKNAKLDLDLGAIADKHYGGGGHAAAAGFVTDYARGMGIIQGKEKWALVSEADVIDACLNDSEDQTGFLKEFLSTPVHMASRLVCEKDKSILQWLPYIVLRNQEKEVFVYQRPDSGDEQRLHGNLSVGLGGHVDSLPPEGVSLARHLAIEATRELAEEVGFSVPEGEVFNVADVIEQKIATGDFGTLRFTHDEVASVHLGIAVILDVQDSWVTNVNAAEVRNARWVPSQHLVNLPTRLGLDYELWSHVVVTQSDI